MKAGITSRARQELMQWLLAPRRYWSRRRMSRPVSEKVCGFDLVILPEVFNPVAFRSGRIFAEFLSDELSPAAEGVPLKILDLGTGSGILAIVCASVGHNVTATDINPVAVDCARSNASRNNFSTISVLQGDLFAPVVDREFDLIVWNPPFFAGEPASRFDFAWRSTDAIERFARQVRQHLSADGRALLIWSSQRPLDYIERIFASCHMHAKTVSRVCLDVEDLIILEISSV